MPRLSALQKLLSFSENHAQWIIASNCLVIIILTWMPFNFAVPLDLSWWAIVSQFQEDSYVSDIIVNILFFMPFGWGWGAWFYQQTQKFQPFLTPIKTLLLSFVLSLAVEIGQLFLGSREPAIVDLITNSFGGFLGSVFLLLVIRFQRSIGYCLRIFRDLQNTQVLLRVLTILWLGYLATMSVLLIDVAEASRLSNWQDNYPLLIGNEKTGDRPWMGTIQELCISDTALDVDFIGQIINQDPCPQLDQASNFSSHYIFNPEQTSFPDQVQNSPNLEARRITTNPEIKQGITFDKNNWLTSIPKPTSLNQNIKTTSQFTLITKIATSGFEQEGPARIISLSQNHDRRNLTIAQSRQDLSLRLTMPFTGVNGKQPEIRLSKFFTDKQFHPLAITYDGVELNFISDNLQKSLYLGSETALFWSVFGVIAEKMFLIVDLEPFNKFLYYSFLFAPLGMLFGLICNLLKTSSSTFILLCAFGLVIPPLLIEGIISSSSDRDFTWQYPLLGVTVLSTSFLLTRFCKRVTTNH